MKSKIAKKMSEELGIDVNEDLVVKLPDDGCPGHMGVPHWDVYAARCGEFTLIANVYSNGDIMVSIV